MMREQGDSPENGQGQGREPVFLLPGSVTAVTGVFIAIHLASSLVLNKNGLLLLIWTPFSHALLHGGWEHLLVNAAWFAIFATPVARRYGAGPMLAMFFVSAAAGAALFAATTLLSGSYLIGASGGVAGLTGAAVRFIFQPVLVTQHPATGERTVLGRQLASFRAPWRAGRAP